jgi:flagellar hook-length control protein FliK
MLDAHQARTAIAEGRSESPDHATPAAVDPHASSDAGTDTDTATGQDDTKAVAAAVLAAVPTPATPVAADSAPATVMVVAGGAPTAVVQVVTPAQFKVATPGAPAPVAVAPGVSAALAATANATAATSAAADAAPLGADGTAAAVPATTPQPDAQKPAATPALGQPATDGSGGSQPQADGKAGQTLQQARAAVAYARPAEPRQQPAAQAAAPAPVAPATGAAPATAPATPVTAATPVPLARSAEAVEHVLRLASSRGVTHARIALSPADLGSVDVHIRSTAEGLVARVVAHSAEAVQTLQNAAGDLRRSLEEHGLTLMSLDIGQSGESGTGRAGSDAGELAGGGRGGSSHEGLDGDDATTTETTTLRLPSGVLVDVLA